MAPRSRLNKQVTMADIAARCGVSKFTVSHALRGNVGRISETTYKKVVAVAREMGYDPSRNESARRLALQKHGGRATNHTVGLCLPPSEQQSVYFSLVFSGFMVIMREHGYEVHTSLLPATGDRLPIACGRGEIDGLATLGSSAWFLKCWLQPLREEPNFGDRPIVAISEPIPGCHGVHPDYFEAGRLAASHLLGLGHRYILHGFALLDEKEYDLPDVPEAASTRKLDGIAAAFSEIGLDPEGHLFDQLLPYDDGHLTAGTDLADFLKRHPEITAIIATNDYSAVRTYCALRKAGYRVPEDISLIGFDDTEALISVSGENLLTTVRLPIAEMGRESARLMIRCIDKKTDKIEIIVLPPELVVRGTTAPPKP